MSFFETISHSSEHNSFGSNIKYFWQKYPTKVQSFRFLTTIMMVHQIPQASFETPRSRLIQILHQSSVSWKITPLYFFISNLYTLDKTSVEVKFWNLWVVGWKSTKFLMSCLKLQVNFSLNFESLLSVIRDNSSVFFSWN